MHSTKLRDLKIISQYDFLWYFQIKICTFKKYQDNEEQRQTEESFRLRT